MEIIKQNANNIILKNSISTKITQYLTFNVDNFSHLPKISCCISDCNCNQNFVASDIFHNPHIGIIILLKNHIYQLLQQQIEHDTSQNVQFRLFSLDTRRYPSERTETFSTFWKVLSRILHKNKRSSIHSKRIYTVF